MRLQRREILKAAALLPATSALGHLSFAASQPSSVLVVVFLRGGADSMQMLAPADDKFYIEARPPELRVLAQGDKQGLRLAKPITDADWRLHPSCAPLLEQIGRAHV